MWKLLKATSSIDCRYLLKGNENKRDLLLRLLKLCTV